jgi:general secretion pathway protein D
MSLTQSTSHARRLSGPRSPSGAVSRAVSIAAVLAIAAWLLPVLSAGAAECANKNAQITPNYKDADLGQIVEAVSELTCKNFIIDPRVRAQVTVISATPMNPQEFYETFLAVLQVNGFIAVPAGKVYKIIPDASARQLPANDLPDHVSGSSDELVTQVIAVKNVSAAQLVPVLRPLMPQNAHLAAYVGSNMLIISDRASNVSRMMRIIGRIDRRDEDDIEIIPLEHASATEVVRVVNALTVTQAAEGGGGPPVRLVADDRTNSILISGEKTQRLRLRVLVAHLDTPLESGGDTQVRYLRYADAEKIAAKLKEQIGVVIAQGTPGQGGAAAGGAVSADKSVTLWAEPETNALVITAPPKAMKSLMQIIDKLDIRRAQVQIEAIIVDMTVDKSAELGVNWVVDGSKNNNAVGGFISPVGGVSIANLLAAANDPSKITPSDVPNGTTIGIGRLKDTGINFAAILRALRSDDNTNIISTPNIVTMENQEAQIKVAQEVPFVTGQFTTTGNTSNNPFQTIQRQEVGTILKVTPQINEGNSIMLKIEQEASSIASTKGAVDLITNKRTISTNVLIEDGGIIALGGLMSDTVTEGNQRVPFLGRIPLLGHLFKTTSSRKVKTNLMVFIRPHILRDDVQTAIDTNSKYDDLRRLQQQIDHGHVPLLPFEKQPVLPPLEHRPAPPAKEAAPSGVTPPQAAPTTPPRQ